MKKKCISTKLSDHWKSDIFTIKTECFKLRHFHTLVLTIVVACECSSFVESHISGAKLCFCKICENYDAKFYISMHFQCFV